MFSCASFRSSFRTTRTKQGRQHSKAGWSNVNLPQARRSQSGPHYLQIVNDIQIRSTIVQEWPKTGISSGTRWVPVQADPAKQAFTHSDDSNMFM
jgi:hypothetical protein